MDRPKTSQMVIDEFTKIIDSQDLKGIEKYKKSIDDANDSDYNWELMALEETADLQKYLVRQILLLKQELKKFKGFSRTSKCLQLEAENLDLYKKSIGFLCQEAYTIAKSKGWHDEPRETGTLLALIHSEVSEALEADRKGNQENFVEELADVCIRIFDLCESRGIDLETAISKKMEFNKSRTYKHGGKAY